MKTTEYDKRRSLLKDNNIIKYNKIKHYPRFINKEQKGVLYLKPYANSRLDVKMRKASVLELRCKFIDNLIHLEYQSSKLPTKSKVLADKYDTNNFMDF